MATNYTLYNEKSISNSCAEDSEEDAVKYLNCPDNFRPFNKGLTELLEKSGFTGDTSDTDVMAEYLISKFRGHPLCNHTANNIFLVFWRTPP